QEVPVIAIAPTDPPHRPKQRQVDRLAMEHAQFLKMIPPLFSGVILQHAIDMAEGVTSNDRGFSMELRIDMDLPRERDAKHCDDHYGQMEQCIFPIMNLPCENEEDQQRKKSDDPF